MSLKSRAAFRRIEPWMPAFAGMTTRGSTLLTHQSPLETWRCFRAVSSHDLQQRHCNPHLGKVITPAYRNHRRFLGKTLAAKMLRGGCPRRLDRRHGRRARGVTTGPSTP
jgi:hypothetical protein